MITLKDIANEAGVSVMTVSRAINGVNSKVSDEKRRQIMEIVERRGYVSNSSARSLSSRSSKLIAVLVKDNIQSSQYNSRMVGYICTCIQQYDYSPLLYMVKDYTYVTKQLRTWNVDGAIFLGLFDSDLKRIQADNKIPLVFTDSYSPIRQMTNVGIDDNKGGVLAARHIASFGHKNIAFVGLRNDDSPVLNERLRGFQQGLAEFGLTIPPGYILPDDPPPTKDELQRLCSGSNPVTAIFATADYLALKIMKELHDAGIRVTEDCSVMGFDDLDISEFCTPALTTIHQDIERKAILATELLFTCIQNRDTPSQNIILDVELVVRGSVAEPPKNRKD